ncbi:MAG: hypothetical protein KZQ90_18350 [Candidatus Thiodiazotropha sp. (ex Codakia rugifera)]|nr:hypothetical protein [Candidatus Thiodiazotropha sp. (ex Codakia rugifera)]
MGYCGKEKTRSTISKEFGGPISMDDATDPSQVMAKIIMIRGGERMWIFYRHLPRGVSTKEIQKVTAKGSRPGWALLPLTKKAAIKRSKIVRIKDLDTDMVEYHAIVQVDSPMIADTIIENLNGKTVNGLFLKPHRYYRRFPNRDRRISQESPNGSDERRTEDRRRNNLITRVLEIS